MKNFTHELWQSAKVLTIALILSTGVQYASAAWTGPTATPPNENTPAPINVSATSQIKSGGLWVGSLGADGGGYFGGNVGIGIASPSQKLSVAGIVESTSGGVKFPDGTIQTTAQTAQVALNKLTCKSYSHPGGMTASDYCSSIGGFCTGVMYFSEFEWFPRGCDYTTASRGVIFCCVPN